MIQRISHYYTKIKQIGLVRFYAAARFRIKKHRFFHRTSHEQLPFFLSLSRTSLSYLNSIALQESALLAHADAYVCNQFSLLGSRPACYLQMPWYEDVRLQHSEDDSFDIKVPWELARFAHAPLLAHAYRHTGDTAYLDTLIDHINAWIDAAPYAQGIHWSNPMEVAIRATNWIVAYQIVRDELQKDARFHERFLKSLWLHMQYIENNWELYDGRTNNHYLSNLVGYAYLCWVFDDRVRWQHCWQELQREFAWQIQADGSSYEGSTAYHGLVTELFLHGFLVAQQMAEKIPKEYQMQLQRMMQFAHDTRDIRIGDDDSGSLMHAGLYDREILWNYLNFFDFCHVENYASCNNTNLYKPFVLRKSVITPGCRSLGVDCLATTGSLLKDTNDQTVFRSNGSKGSPRTVLNYCIFSQLKSHCGLGVQLNIFNSISHYPNFGLSLMRQDPWNISLRHHSYQGRQPSAHFHEDVASITLAYSGIPILVDPGTYLYTGSKEWRNYFRSAAQHSTFFPVGWNQKGDDLFALVMPEANAQYECAEQSMRTIHSLFGYPVSRTVQWSEYEVIIQDDVSHASDQMEWNFLFSSELSLQKSEQGWAIVHAGTCLLYVQCDTVVFEKREAWISPAYGVKQPAWALWTRAKQAGPVSIRFKREKL